MTIVLLLALTSASIGADETNGDSGLDFLQNSLRIQRLQLEAQGHVENQHFEEAIQALEEVQALADPRFEPSRYLLEINSGLLSDLNLALGRPSKALEHARERLHLLKNRQASDSETATALLQLGKIERYLGDSGAKGHLDRAVRLREQRLGSEHRDTAEVYEALGAWHFEQGDFDAARDLFEDSRRILELNLTPGDPRLASLYGNLAEAYRSEGRLEEARNLLEQAQAIQLRHHAERPIELANTLQSLGLVLIEQRRLTEANEVLTRSIEIQTSLLGPEHPGLITALTSSAWASLELQYYEIAEDFARRAVRIAKLHFDEHHRLVVGALRVLGSVLVQTGELIEARRILSRNLEVLEANFGSEHTETALTRAALGQAFEALGNAEEGLVLMDEALDAFLQDDSDLDALTGRLILDTLGAAARYVLENRDKASDPSIGSLVGLEDFLFQSLEGIYGNPSEELADLRQIFAMFELARGDVGAARETHQQSIEIQERLASEGHPGQMAYWGNASRLMIELGNLPGAISSMQRALEISIQIYGPRGRWTAQPRVDLASILESQGRIGEALDYLEPAMRIEEEGLGLVLGTGSEEDQRRFLRTFEGTMLLMLSLHQRSAPSDPRVLDMALETVLKRKGRGLDAAMLSARLALATQGSGLREEIRSLNLLRSRWAHRMGGGEENITWAEIEASERRIADAFGAEALPPVSVSQVQAALPDQSVLVEFVTIEPPDVENYRNDPMRYLAYLLDSDGGKHFVDLGLAEPIHLAVDRFLEAIQKRDPAVRSIGRELDELVIAPMRPWIERFETLIISPAEELHRVPFAALVDKEGEYLVTKLNIGYVSSGRDLIALDVPKKSAQGPPLIVADPDFGRRDGAEGDGALAQLSLEPLPGLVEEAKAVGDLLDLSPERILLRSQATEEAVRAVEGPLILHIATHGFLLPDSSDLGADRWTRGLARSGLALSGIGSHYLREPQNDGFLSAIEMSYLDLAGTEIATFSACHTGQGEIMGSHGLFGLRRALALAGARTQVTSLWAVDDRAAVDLMKSWYSQVVQGVPRGRAMQRAQIAMINGEVLPGLRRRGAEAMNQGSVSEMKEGRHPYYWAVFTIAGDLGSIPEINAEQPSDR